MSKSFMTDEDFKSKVNKIEDRIIEVVSGEDKFIVLYALSSAARRVAFAMVSLKKINITDAIIYFEDLHKNTIKGLKKWDTFFK